MRLNRYARSQKHRAELKRKHALRNGRYNPDLDRQREEDWFFENCDSRWVRNQRNFGYHYWNQCYLSGCRRYAKEATNRRIRSKYRTMVANAEREDIIAPHGSDYEKEFDYWWTIY